MKITIQWHGHSCFSVTAYGYTVVLDPYDDSLEGYAPLSLTGNAVLCSHGHHDHAWVQAVELEKTDLPCPFTVEKVLTAHDDCGGTKRGENIIHVLSVDGKRIVHCGDLGHALSPAQVNAIGDADVLLLPVGGFYTIDAAVARTVSMQLSAKTIIPMHYRFDGYGIAVIAQVDDFLALAGETPVNRVEQSTLVLDGDAPKQIAILSYNR